MKGKSWQIPVNTGKYSCACCGGKLTTEKTHRVVTKEDRDYFQYQRYNTFPRVDHDVYGFEYKCTSCGNYTSFHEQKIIHKLQKKCGSNLLSKELIKQYMPTAKNEYIKSRLWRNILINIVVFLIWGIALIANVNPNSDDISKAIGLVFLLVSIPFTFYLIFTIKKFNGTFKWRGFQGYSFADEILFTKLHASSKNNRELVEKSNMCHCFHCRKSFRASDIKSYTDYSKSAMCPNCNKATLIPDAIDEKILPSVLNQMHDYWF